jgi:hypothetical protein
VGTGEAAPGDRLQSSLQGHEVLPRVSATAGRAESWTWPFGLQVLNTGDDKCALCLVHVLASFCLSPRLSLARILAGLKWPHTTAHKAARPPLSSSVGSTLLTEAVGRFVWISSASN